MESAWSPVFILGLHRSGTTLLYQMLASSGCFRAVTARHVILFDELASGRSDRERSVLQLADRFARLGLTTRLVDAVALTPDMPEEYGFLLDRFSGSPALSRRTLPTLRLLCERIRRESNGDGPMLLKNPWDFGLAARISSLLPGARFVFIHRNPYHVISSMQRLVTETILRPNEYLSLLSPRYREFMAGEFPLRAARWTCRHCPSWIVAGLVAFAAHQTDRYLRNRHRVPAESAMDIRFENLCERPNETIANILRHLGVSNSVRDCSNWIGSPRSEICAEVAGQRKRIDKRLGRYAAAVGYGLSAIDRTSSG